MCFGATRHHRIKALPWSKLALAALTSAVCSIISVSSAHCQGFNKGIKTWTSPYSSSSMWAKSECYNRKQLTSLLRFQFPSCLLFNSNMKQNSNQILLLLLFLLSIKCQKIVKIYHHNFTAVKLTSLKGFFCPACSFESKEIWFTMISNIKSSKASR